MSSLPVALETSRPIGRRNKGARTFWYGPPSYRAPGRASLRYRLRRALRGYRLCLIPFGTDTADAPTKLSSHDLHHLEQTREVLEKISAVLATSPSVALDREAPFGGEGSGSEFPLAFSSGVGAQGKSR
eukprot:6194930-Pleurochrysis_carterae.AAC.1